MAPVMDRFPDTAVPQHSQVIEMDARELPPPKPLTQTLSNLEDLPEDAVLVQRNDRAPQHLYPQLDERGFRYETVSTDDGALTAIWRATDE